jgi:hypothetical protein
MTPLMCDQVSTKRAPSFSIQDTTQDSSDFKSSSARAEEPRVFSFIQSPLDIGIAS